MVTYYDVDLRKARLREFLTFDMHWWLVPLVVPLKLLGCRFLASTDDPPVDALGHFEEDPSDLPEDIQGQFAPLLRDMRGLGFRDAIAHSIPDPLHATRSYWATLLHSSGQAWGRVHCRVLSAQGRDRIFLFPMFFTEFDDDTFLITSAGKPDFLMPSGTRMVYQVGADCKALLERHGAEREHDFRLTPRRIANKDELRAAMERLHGRIRDYLLDRGIFQPLSEVQQARLQSAIFPVGEDVELVAGGRRTPIRRRPPIEPVEAEEVVELVAEPVADDLGQDQSPNAHLPPGRPVDPEEAAVLVELERLQNRQTSGLSMLLVLAVSVGLFMTALNMGQGQELLWSLLPILGFHELGHYLAMRWFGYRNLRMFFIPFFGAAVSGKHYNVPGWKKAVVALLGPVPGIFLGGILGFLGIIFDIPYLVHTALFMEIINGFNLLPLLPLDGGWVLHAVLFVRHPVLDVAFRGLTIVALFGLAWLIGDKILMILPALMLLGLPAAWRIAQVAHRLRRRGVGTVSPDSQTVPPETAHTILSALREKMPRNRIPSLLAAQVLQVFETMNARPPGVAASIALLAVHVLSFFASLVLAIVLVLGAGWWLGNRGPLPPLVENPPAHTFERGQTALWRGPDAPARPSDSGFTLIATSADAAAAQKAFQDLQHQVPRNATLRWFGHDVLLILPSDQKAAHDLWLGRLRALDPKAAARRPGETFTVRLALQLPEGPAGEHLERELLDYLEVPNCELLIPPWSPEWTELPAADLKQFRKSRRTLRRLHEIPLLSARKFILNPPRADRIFGRQEDLVEEMKAAARAAEEEQKRLLEQIRAEDRDTIDQAMLPLWDALQQLQRAPIADNEAQDPPGFGRQRNALLQQMARCMGMLPLQADRPAPGSDLAAARFGHHQREGRTLVVFISFYHPHEGLPALADWLTRHGDRHLRYEFPKLDHLDDDEP